MTALTKRFRLIKEKLEFGKVYSITDAIATLQGLPPAKFLEGIDVSINLGIDPRKSDQVVRGATDLPHGTGKIIKVAVFAQGANADAAREAGADLVGFEDLAEEIKAGNLDFNVIIASPDAMRIVGQLGPLLGPRGLMPNPKVGTVTPDVATAVRKAKAGQVRYRSDKAGIIHCNIGKINFTAEQLKQNIEALLSDLKKLKPSSAKGVYMKKLSITSTMGPGLAVDLSSLDF